MNDRGMIKWAPFNSVVNGNDVIKQIELENKRISKPTLSEDQIFELEEKIKISYENASRISIHYYRNNLENIIDGIIIKIDAVNKKIVLDGGLSIYFNNIMQIF